MARIKLTIAEAEKRHPDLIKGQVWRGNATKYLFRCGEGHGVYTQWYTNHARQGGCPTCNREKQFSAEGQSQTPEYTSIKRHHYAICISDSLKNLNYKGMPFYADWNPNAGGSFLAGYRWIIENIGPRPQGCSLHIMHHDKGFTPGNLCWASPTKQTTEQTHRIIGEQRYEIAKLKQEIAELRIQLEKR